MFSKLYEMGLSVIPLKVGEKVPSIIGWQKYCYTMPTTEEIDAWDRLFKRDLCGISLACGKASGIIALDLDSDNKDLLNLAPMSPVIKRGKNGETRFFKYNDSIKLSHFNSIDILSDGSHTVLPPSIHPLIKKPYTWLTPDTLENFDKNDLPDLDLNFIDDYIRLANKLSPDKNKNESSGGRNNWLKSIVAAMRFNGDSEADIIENIFNLDLTKNEKR